MSRVASPRVDRRPGRSVLGTVEEPGRWARVVSRVALSLATWIPFAHAATFHEPEPDPTSGMDVPVVLGINPTGEQLVGYVQYSAPGTLTEAGFAYGETTLQLTQIGPPAAGLVSIKALDQATSSDGLIRRTVGSSQAAGVSDLQSWIRVEDFGMGTDTTTVLPAYPATATTTVAADVSENGDLLGLYLVPGPAIGYYHYDADTTTYTELVDMIPTEMDLSGGRVVGLATDNEPITYEALLWDEADGYRKLGTLAGGFNSVANGISASGRIVVGASQSANLPAGEYEAMRWHPDLGMHALEPIDAAEDRESEALATSDANVVVGWYRVGAADERAFIWTPDVGRRDLKSYLSAEYGLGPDVSGWVLERATHISADGKIIAGKGISPVGDSEAWAVDLTQDDHASVRLRPVAASTSPSLWEIFVRCGDLPITELYLGVIPSADFLYDDPFDFGDCTDDTVNPPFERFCTGASGIGPTVSDSSFITLPLDTPVGSARAATPYLHLIGDGGPLSDSLCQPGDPEVLLGSLEVPNPTPELIFNAIEGEAGRDDEGDPISAELIELARERDPSGVELTVRAELGNVDGSRWSVSAEAPDAYSSLSFGIIVPPNEQGVSFGGCLLGLGVDDRRECEDGDDLGSDVDFAAVRTVGPSANLAAFGLRTDTIYVYVGGTLPTGTLASFNTPGNRTRLGIFEFDAVSAGFAFVPTLTFEGVENLDSYWSDFIDWTDNEGFDQTNFIPLSGTGYGTGDDPDWDGDGLEDADDKCPYVVSSQNLDDGTLQQVGPVSVAASLPDNVGNECQCGDSQTNSSVTQPDIDMWRDALMDPVVAGTLTQDQRDLCNSIGPEYSSLDSSRGLDVDCQINDVFTLLKARQGDTPLIPNPGEFPSCPDVFTP